MNREQCELRAMDWLDRRAGPEWGAADETALDAWLNEAPEHQAAFWRLEYGEHRLERLASLRGILDADRRQENPTSKTLSWASLAVAAGLAAVVIGWTALSSPRTYTTEIGGRETVPLVDGSRIELNTQTRLRTRVARSARDVWLDQGEAFFNVAHDKTHPFVVHAGAKVITVLGTKFSVRRDGDRVTVAVLEGRVRVDDLAAPEKRTLVTRGDIAVASPTSTLVATDAPEKVADALSWRAGRLKFHETPLLDAATEFNRYNRIRLVIIDEAAAATRIGGNFDADDVEDFAALLHSAYGFDVKQNGAVLTISSPR